MFKGLAMRILPVMEASVTTYQQVGYMLVCNLNVLLKHIPSQVSF